MLNDYAFTYFVWYFSFFFFKQGGKFDPCFYISSRSLAFLNIFLCQQLVFDMLGGSHVIIVINIYLSLPSQSF